jgi:hypothetical protein
MKEKFLGDWDKVEFDWAKKDTEGMLDDILDKLKGLMQELGEDV